MYSIASQLETLIMAYLPQLNAISEEQLYLKPSPTKWSRKEIIGHLIDSAQNNIRRFVIAQYEDNPSITYNQDKWVAAANYQEYSLDDLINLWVLLNKHIIMILKNLPEGGAAKEVQSEETHTVDWLAADYNKHLLHHLHQILNLEEVPYR